MKHSIRNPFLICLLVSIAVLSCKKSGTPSVVPVPPVPTAADPVDTIIGVYSGTMHISSQVVHYSDWAHPSLFDTTYTTTVNISKIAADTFMVASGITFQYYSWTTYSFLSHIALDSSDTYISYHPSGFQTDTLRFIRSADSMYYISVYHKPGGATTEYRTQTFSGTR